MKNITIHSHQRSGTMFIQKNIAEIFKVAGKHPGINEVQKSLTRDIENSENFKVAVLRNPVDTIFSLYVHSAYFNGQEDQDFNPHSIKMLVDLYVRHYKALEEHADSLHIYKFENLEKIVLDIASRFVDVPDDYAFKSTEDQENNLASAKSVKMYNEVIDSFDNYDFFDPAFEIYNRLMQKASIIV
jgi:hypothetical protein